MLNKPVLLLALAMFLAIGTERLLELIRALIEHIEARAGAGDRWEKKARTLRDRIEARLDNAGAGTSSALRMALSIVCRHLSPAPPESGGLIAVNVDQVRSMSIRVTCKILGIVFGIGLAFLFGIDLFALVNEELHGGKGCISIPGVACIRLPPQLGTIVSGVAMGLGAGPVHKMIVALERARRTRL